MKYNILFFFHTAMQFFKKFKIDLFDIAADCPALFFDLLYQVFEIQAVLRDDLIMILFDRIDQQFGPLLVIKVDRMRDLLEGLLFARINYLV